MDNEVQVFRSYMYQLTVYNANNREIGSNIWKDNGWGFSETMENTFLPRNPKQQNKTEIHTEIAHREKYRTGDKDATSNLKKGQIT